jgi:hypothetical protein
MREGNGAGKSNVLTSGSAVTNHKSGPDFLVFTIIYFSLNVTYLVRFFAYPLRCLRVPPEMCVSQVEDLYIEDWAGFRS